MTQPLYDIESSLFRQNPYPTYATLRQEAPVYEMPSQLGRTWFVTRYEDIEFVLKDKHFGKDMARAFAPEAWNDPKFAQMNRLRSLLNVDPPDHTRLRALVSKAFTPNRIAELRPRVNHFAQELIEAIKTQEQVDLITAYAEPLPMNVICEMLGVPKEDQPRFRAWTRTMISLQTANVNDLKPEVGMAFMEFVSYITDLTNARRATPGEDLITALIQAEEDGDKLDQLELNSMIFLLILAGHETTVNLIGNGTFTLLRNPEQLARLKTEPGLMETAVEEMLRYESPVETSTRSWVLEDVELGGKLLQRGDCVISVFGSANRDTTQFSAPNAFDVARPNNRHFAFGHGIHYCLGAPLARMEGQIAFQTLLDNLPNLRLAVPVEELTWNNSILIRGLKNLPVTWDK